MAVDFNRLQERAQTVGLTWQPGLTAHSDHSLLLARSRTGAVPPAGTPSLADRERVASAQAARAESRVAVGIPVALDWRAAGGNYVTSIKDQGGCGSCVAFGAIGVLESMVRIATRKPTLAVDLSEAQLFFCYGPTSGAGACPEGGWWPDEAFDSMRQGVVDEACFPYTDADQACRLQADWRTRLTSFSSSTTKTSIAEMKKFIATVGPMTACLTIYEDFYYYYAGGVYTYHAETAGDVVGGHCVQIVGYDDAQHCWIAKNQWGTAWGENGYFRMSYGSCGIDAEMWGIDGTLSLPAVGPRLQVTGLAGGKLWHTLRNAGGVWQSAYTDVDSAEANHPGPFTAISCAGVGSNLDVIGIAGGQPWHTLRTPNGPWAGAFGNIDQLEGNHPGPFTAISCAAVGSALDVIGVAAGRLWHTLRAANGRWAPVYGNIDAVEANHPGPFTAVSCAGVGSTLQVVGIAGGRLWHTLRTANGRWAPVYGNIDTVEANHPGPFTAVSCAAVGQTLHVVAISGGKLWHTARNPSGSWQRSYGNIDAVEANHPGPFTAVSCSSTVT